MVGIVHRMELDHFVSVGEVIERTGSLDEGGDDFALVDALAGTVYDAFFNQGQQIVGEHFGVDP